MPHTAILTVSTTCVFCGKEHLTEMPFEKYVRWHNGEHLQKVFPDWTPDQREIVISGTCPQCWEQNMSDPEPDIDPAVRSDVEIYGAGSN
jgi:hypothetical protein